QQPPSAFVVALASQGVAALMVIDLGGQRFQEGPGNQAVVPAGRDLRRDRAMDLRYGPLRVFPPVVAGLLASGTGSSDNSGTDDGSGPDRSGPRNDSGPTPTSGLGSTAPRGGGSDRPTTGSGSACRPGRSTRRTSTPPRAARAASPPSAAVCR